MYRRLRDLREDRDLNQQAVAAVLHVSQATYSRYESGALDIPSAALIALAQFYGTSTDYLLGLTGNPMPYSV
jgi:transcriptional regulator with XRE-family HTH domain